MLIQTWQPWDQKFYIPTVASRRLDARSIVTALVPWLDCSLIQINQNIAIAVMFTTALELRCWSGGVNSATLCLTRPSDPPTARTSIFACAFSQGAVVLFIVHVLR